MTEQHPTPHPDILVVDHSLPFRELLEIALADEGYNVVSTHVRPDPAATLDGSQPALIIAGIKPAEQGDLDLLAYLRRQDDRSRVLVVSTDPQLLLRIRREPDRYAADAFLRLPLDLDDLSACVRALIGSSSDLA